MLLVSVDNCAFILKLAWPFVILVILMCLIYCSRAGLDWMEATQTTVTSP